MDPTVINTVSGIEHIVYAGLVTIICTVIGTLIGACCFKEKFYWCSGIGFMIGLLGSIFTIIISL